MASIIFLSCQFDLVFHQEKVTKKSTHIEACAINVVIDFVVRNNAKFKTKYNVMI